MLPVTHPGLCGFCTVVSNPTAPGGSQPLGHFIPHGDDHKAAGPPNGTRSIGARLYTRPCSQTQVSVSVCRCIRPTNPFPPGTTRGPKPYSSHTGRGLKSANQVNTILGCGRLLQPIMDPTRNQSGFRVVIRKGTAVIQMQGRGRVSGLGIRVCWHRPGGAMGSIMYHCTI